MPLKLDLANLASRRLRTASTPGGVRRIATTATATQGQATGLGAIYSAVTKFGISLMSAAFNGIKALFTFSWSKLWGQIANGVNFLINFNWNITDADMDSQIKQAEIGLASAKGSLAGQSLGFAVCGLAPAATIAVFNKPLALYMMAELGEEAADEIGGSLAALCTLQFQQSARVAFFSLFKNYRTLFRGAALGFAKVLVLTGQLTQASLDKANKKRNEPWSIASAKEESIEAIADPISRAYWEEFWDEFADSCIEAGFIIAGAADGFFAQQKMANQSLLGSERTLEITMNRSIDAPEIP